MWCVCSCRERCKECSLAGLTCCLLAQVEDSMEDGTPADQHMRKIAVHVSAYITHVRTQLKQTIPKAIVHCLVRRPV